MHQIKAQNILQENDSIPNEEKCCQTFDIEINLMQIPWNDIIFPFIFKHLSWRDLFRFRGVSQTALIMTNEYFKSLNVIDLCPVSRRFTAQSFERVTNECKNVRILNLANCKWINSELLIPVIEYNPHIVVLDISGCYEVTNDTLHKLALNCKSLKTLKLKECHWVNAFAITNIAFNCSNLEDVNLVSCWEVSDDSAIDLITNCINLKQLSLSKIYGITDRTLNALAVYAKNLEYLNVSGCWRITDYGIRKIGEYCHSLSHLIVGDCRDVTDDSLSYLRSKGIYVDVPIKHRSHHLNAYLNHFSRIRLQV